MAKPKFVPYKKGFGQLLAGPEVARMVRGSGDRIAAASGGEADTWLSDVAGTGESKSHRWAPIPQRVVSGVKAPPGRDADETLLRARGAGRV